MGADVLLVLRKLFSWRQQGSDRLLHHRLCMLVASCHLKFLFIVRAAFTHGIQSSPGERLFLGVPVPGTQEPRMEEELPECCRKRNPRGSSLQ